MSCKMPRATVCGHLDALQGLLEGEGHAAANDELVHLVNHVLDQLDLICDLGPAEDGQERALGGLNGLKRTWSHHKHHRGCCFARNTA